MYFQINIHIKKGEKYFNVINKNKWDCVYIKIFICWQNDKGEKYFTNKSDYDTNVYIYIYYIISIYIYNTILVV